MPGGCGLELPASTGVICEFETDKTNGPGEPVAGGVTGLLWLLGGAGVAAGGSGTVGVGAGVTGVGAGAEGADTDGAGADTDGAGADTDGVVSGVWTGAEGVVVATGATGVGEDVCTTGVVTFEVFAGGVFVDWDLAASIVGAASDLGEFAGVARVLAVFGAAALSTAESSDDETPVDPGFDAGDEIPSSRPPETETPWFPPVADVVTEVACVADVVGRPGNAVGSKPERVGVTVTRIPENGLRPDDRTENVDPVF